MSLRALAVDSRSSSCLRKAAPNCLCPSIGHRFDTTGPTCVACLARLVVTTTQTTLANERFHEQFSEQVDQLIVRRRRAELRHVNALEPLHGPRKSFGQVHSRFPPKHPPRKADVGAALRGIILREWASLFDTRGATHRPHHPLRQLADGELLWVAKVHGPSEVIVSRHRENQTIDKVVDIAERPRLHAIAVQREGFTADRLSNEVADHSAVIRMHPWSVGIEDANHLDSHTIDAPVVEHQRLRRALPLVVAGTRPNRIHIPSVVLRLWMHIGVAVHLARGCLQHLRAKPLRQSQRMHRAHHAGLQRLDWIVLVVTRRGGTGKVVDLVNLELETLRDIVANELEMRLTKQVLDVQFLAREQVVEAHHLVARREQSFTQVGTEKPCPARDQDPLAHWHRSLATAILRG